MQKKSILLNKAQILLTAIVLVLLVGCATPQPVRVTPAAKDGIQINYDNGAPVLRSHQVNSVELALLNTTSDAMMFRIAVTNGASESFDLSTADIELVQSSADNATQRGKVYSRDDLGAANNYALAWDSASMLTSSVVPAVVGGGMASSLINQLIGMGVQEVRQNSYRKATLDSTLTDNYLRRHTLAPGESYNGVVKVALPHTPAPGDSIQLKLNTPFDNHTFQFTLPSA